MTVSVIVPVYNTEQYLAKCIESILHQTYTDLEVILVNDGSTDHSGELCDAFSKKDSRVKVVHKKNGGVSSARNAGIEAATGEYIIFIDGDDWFSLDAVSSMVAMREETQADLVVGNHTCVTRFGEVPSNVQNAVYETEEIGNHLLQLCVSNGRSSWNKLFRTDLIQKHKLRFPVGIPVGEDAMFSASYIGICEKILISSKITYYYNKLVENNAMSKIRPEFYSYQANIFATYKTSLEHMPKEVRKEKTLSELASFFCAEAIYYHLYFTLWKSSQKQTISKIIEYYRPYLLLQYEVSSEEKVTKEEFELLLDGKISRFLSCWKRRQKKNNKKMYYKAYFKLLLTKTGCIKWLKTNRKEGM